MRGYVDVFRYVTPFRLVNSDVSAKGSFSEQSLTTHHSTLQNILHQGHRENFENLRGRWYFDEAEDRNVRRHLTALAKVKFHVKPTTPAGRSMHYKGTEAHP